MIQGDISAAEAALVALSGVVIVFLMLAVLWGIINVISFVMTRVQPQGAPAAGAPAAQSVQGARKAAMPAAPVAAPAVQLVGLDETSAACIMAIVSHETGIPLQQLQFRSIRSLGVQEGKQK